MLFHFKSINSIIFMMIFPPEKVQKEEALRRLKRHLIVDSDLREFY